MVSSNTVQPPRWWPCTMKTFRRVVFRHPGQTTARSWADPPTTRFSMSAWRQAQDDYGILGAADLPDAVDLQNGAVCGTPKPILAPGSPVHRLHTPLQLTGAFHIDGHRDVPPDRDTTATRWCRGTGCGHCRSSGPAFDCSAESNCSRTAERRRRQILLGFRRCDTQ